MAWWQKKLLRYALSRTGLLDDQALNLDNLDITFGRQNVVELKDVGLNIKRITKLAQLPPALRVETAKILSLRLTVPADVYQSSIVAEVDGVELGVKLEEQDVGQGVVKRQNANRARSPVRAASPQHRKVHRRIHSPPPYDPGGLDPLEEAHIPTTHELVQSFLLQEPLQERRQLEASVALNSKPLEESFASESSESDDYGTGAAVGLPGFLAGFLQGIVDRLQVHVKNVAATLETNIGDEGKDTVPISLRVRIGSVALGSLAQVESNSGGRRKIDVREISFELLSSTDVFEEFSRAPSNASPALSRTSQVTSPRARASTGISEPHFSPLAQSLAGSRDSVRSPKTHAGSPEMMRASVATDDADRFADAGEEEGLQHSLSQSQLALDIRPGDDNISWGSRRSKSSAPSQDLWRSMASEDDLPESLLLERAATPRAHSSRSISPEAQKTRRNVSPYSRTLHSPGSWPNYTDPFEQSTIRQSPGSWPTLHQNEPSMFQSPTPAHELPSSVAVDNKRAAFEGTSVDEPIPADRDKDMGDDLVTSRLFTHDEAQSMYMSAMSHEPQMHMPGGWSSEGSPSERSESPQAPRHTLPLAMQSTSSVRECVPAAPKTGLDDDLAYGERPYSTPQAPLSGNATPRVGTPGPVTAARPATPTFDNMRKSSKPLIYIDTLSLLLPMDKAVTEESVKDPVQRMTASRSTALNDLPGTFSAYSNLAASRRGLGASVNFADPTSNVIEATQREDMAPGNSTAISADIGVFHCQIDVSCARLLYRVSTVSSRAIKAMNFTTPVRDNDSSEDAADPGSPSISLDIREFGLAFKHTLGSFTSQGSSPLTPQDDSITLLCQDVAFSQHLPERKLQIGTLKAFVGMSCLLSFDRDTNQDSSVVLTHDTPDLAIIILDKVSTLRRPTTDITAECLPIKILIDLPTIDEAFESFGGLSGVLEVGNSMLSESGIGSSPSSPGRAPKGVRFEGEPERFPLAPEIKFSARFGGLAATLRATMCDLCLSTSVIKVIYREIGASATMSHVRLSGPHADGERTLPFTVDLSTLRVDYLTTPQDSDLERLLSLLTPSKDKYDSDDDILIDTLIRQRRKGAVARVSVGAIKINCEDWSGLEALSSLGGELSRLSAVAKYLPDDDRPGILSLIRVQKCEARIPVNNRFGDVLLSVSDFHCAHVGLPALMALSVNSIQASQDGKAEMLTHLVPLSGSDNLPMLMARMLGDEVVPTVKIKLFNVAVNYSVPMLLDLTNIDIATAPEEIVTELAHSIADIATSRAKPLQAKHKSSGAERSDNSKITKLDILVHDSALVLSPQKSSAKGLLVLADVALTTHMPPGAESIAILELRKAGIFVADQIFQDPIEIIPSRSTSNNTAVSGKLTFALSKMGYVSVGSILAAKISLHIEATPGNGDKSVEADVTAQLVLLETCADSTQTLISVCNGVVPPTPPGKQQQYLTEPIAIEDMMASFSGDAFPKPEQPPQTLFDAEEQPEENDDDLLFDIPKFEEDDDGLLAESDMSSSLYGPVDGLLGGEGELKSEDESQYFSETAESLLEDDPFEMTIPPPEAPMNDAALVRELNKQRKPVASDRLVDIGHYEIEDLGFDALDRDQTVLGTAYRFTTPHTGRKHLSGQPSQKLPFRLRVRDLHLIWNIYDGYDWQRTRNGITDAVEQVEQRAEQRKAKRRQSQAHSEDEESVIGDFLFNSIYIGVPSNQDAQDLRRQINRHIDDLASETESVPMSGMSRPSTFSASARTRPRRRLKLERSRSHKIAFELKGVSADVLVFPPGSGEIVSSVDVRVHNVEIFDNVPTSTWRKFLTHLDKDPNGREMAKPMAHIELMNLRTLENYAASEIALHVSILPLRLHVDQDALDFITRFFEFKDDAAAPGPSDGDQPFLQRVEVETVDLRLDYKPKKVDYAGLRSGHTTEFMNFVILDAANIRLKHAIIYGLRGFEPLHKTLNDIWMPDVKRNQLPTVLAGLAPVRSLVNIGTGVRDVVAIPVREYQKDGRIVRSIQKGAFHFGKTTASELARLGAKVAIRTQNLLQGAEDLLSPAAASPSARHAPGRRSPSDQGWHDIESDAEDSERRAISSYANQPLNVLGGLRSARRYLEHDLLTARDALIAVQGEVLESSSAGSALGAVARHAPTVILRPIIGTSRAMGTALLGVGNAIDRDGLKRVDDVSILFVWRSE